MPFEDDLRRQFETLTDRIREEVTRQLAIASSELTASLDADRSAAVRQAVSEARTAAERDAAVRTSEAVAVAERDAAVRTSEAVAAAERDAAVRTSEAVAAAEARARAAGREEGRLDGLAEGRQGGREEAHAEARGIERAAGERLVEAVRAIGRARSLSEILDALAAGASREAARVGVLLIRGEQIQGWRFIGFGPALADASRFELPLAEAGIIADAARTGEAASADSGPRAAAPAFAELPPGREMLAVPVPMSGQVVAVLYADQASDPPDRDAPSPVPCAAWQAGLEVLARHAARCLEAITAVRAAQVFSERPAPAAATPRDRTEAGSADGAGDANAPADEDAAARRYARLLISEIKLYHEPAVIAGRRDRDVAARLGGEIARARVLYEQRVPAHVRRAHDHFHAELVRTLADGDPSLLGQLT